MTLTNYEKETIINYNEAEGTASIYTCSPVLMRKLKGLSERSYEIKLEKETDYSVTYSMPKSYIKIHLPHKRQELSEEQKEILRQRMKKLHEKQKSEKE